MVEAELVLLEADRVELARRRSLPLMMASPSSENCLELDRQAGAGVRWGKGRATERGVWVLSGEERHGATARGGGRIARIEAPPDVSSLERQADRIVGPDYAEEVTWNEGELLNATLQALAGREDAGELLQAFGVHHEPDRS